jgi:hypothetical protein
VGLGEVWISAYTAGEGECVCAGGRQVCSWHKGGLNLCCWQCWRECGAG